MYPQFKVGDIVMTKDKEQKKMVPALVTNVDREWLVSVLFADGNYGWRLQTKVKPTERHIDIQKILDSIK